MLCLVAQWLLTLCDSMQLACQASLSMGVSRQEYWSGFSCHPQGDLPNPGIQPRSPALQADSLLTEPPGKPKNSGVDTLPLFQAQESNYGLLHCLRIIYQLSYRWSPENIQLMIRKIWFWSQVFVKPQSSTGFSSTKYFICIYLMLVFWETAWNSGSWEIYSDHLGRCWL